MKLTDKLFERVRGLWEEALEKPFVTGMADGSLEESRFRYYMLQDYIYLKEYIRLLENTKGIAESPVLREFLQIAIDSTNEETYRVHVPNMKKLGITDEEISGAGQSEFSREYTVYMTRLLEEEGGWSWYVMCMDCGSQTASFDFKTREERKVAAQKAANLWNMGKVVRSDLGE